MLGLVGRALLSTPRWRESWCRLRHRSSKKDVYLSLRGDLLYGILPVTLAIQAGRRTIHRLYCNPGSRRAVEAAALVQGVEVVEMDREALDGICRQVDKYKEHHVHQGLVADVSRLHHSPLDYSILQDTRPPDGLTRPPLWLLLCGVRDPINLGTIVRTAHFLGVEGVAVCGPRCHLTSVVSKASVGALEVTPIHLASKPEELLQHLSSRGWAVLAAGLGGAALHTLPVGEHRLSSPTILLLGSEGEGVPEELLRHCHLGVAVPPSPSSHPLVDSLNVSVATGAILHALLAP